MKPLIIAISAAALTASSALAEGDWIVGIIADGDQSPYVGGDDSVEAIPYIAYETERFYIGIDGLRYHAFDNGSVSIDAFLDPRFAPDMPDTALFEGLDRDDTLEAGLSATYSFGPMYAVASVQADIAGAHDGLAGEVAVGYEAALGTVMFDASAGIRYRDANLNAHLYGVSAAEATATRPAFEISDTANAFAEISAIVPIGAQTFFIGEVSYMDLGEAAASPLVDRDDQFGVLIGIGYQF